MSGRFPFCTFKGRRTNISVLYFVEFVDKDDINLFPISNLSKIEITCLSSGIRLTVALADAAECLMLSHANAACRTWPSHLRSKSSVLTLILTYTYKPLKRLGHDWNPMGTTRHIFVLVN